MAEVSVSFLFGLLEFLPLPLLYVMWRTATKSSDRGAPNKDATNTR
jgi:hypothetical protein